MSVAQALWAGILAGLGVALPLGAIGVLLVTEGLRHGWRPGLAGALAVAFVDLSYAVLAVVLGTSLSAWLSPIERQVQLLGAAVLLVVSGLGIARTIADVGRADPRKASPEPQADSAQATPASPGRAFLRFVGLTALNPLTAVYFVALTVALADRLDTPASATAFVLGVFVASLAWQSVLVSVGVLAGGRLPARAGTVLSLVGFLAVGCYGIALALG